MSNAIKKFLFSLKYNRKDEHTQQIGAHQLIFSTMDEYSKSWFFPRYDKGRIHEPVVSDLLNDLLKPKDCFFDVGANLGFFTCLAGKICHEGSVHAFEMDQHCIPVLENNITANQLDNVMLNNVAVSNMEGFEKIPIISQPNAGLRMINSYQPQAFRKVTAITLDDYCKEFELQPNIIKIDVEGAELKVLEGMTELLKTDVQLLVEVHPDMLPDFDADYHQVIQLLLNYQFKIDEIIDHRKDGKKLEKKAVSKGYELTKNTMLFAYKS